ncbi:carbohydrate-binding protein [Clostridium sp. YIM B02555]|uniref:carbohydrate-binding protein n=1 Tax=Clostridium sp. YIM B02555 TaxID=2911968 RepID=UPI001EEE2CDA|nr:carbohydrate-binding protein [Clostridium sp. YIM B02555]
MNTKRNILSITLKLCMVLILSFGIFAPGTKVFAASNDSTVVSLLNASYESHYGKSPEQSIWGQVLVKNLAYAKNVTIHYSHNGIDWLDTSASFYKKLSNNDEVWNFKLSEGLDVGRKYIFDIRYEVNGQIYWDNNNGQNYSIEGTEYNSGVQIFNNGPVELYTANSIFDINGNQSILGTISLQNLAYDKNVNVLYSDDNGKTYKEVSAKYGNSYNNNSVENWTFSIDGLPRNSKIEFAIKYTVNGQTYLCNNWGSNFVYNPIK